MKRIILYLLLIFFHTTILVGASEKWKESNYYTCFDNEKKPQFFLFFPPDKKILTFVPWVQDRTQRLLNIIVNDEIDLVARLGDPIAGEGMQIHLNKETNKLSLTVKVKNKKALPALAAECHYKP